MNSSLESLLETDPARVFWSLYRKEENARKAQRYHALALLCELTPVDEVARILHVHENTILRWIDRYNKKGLQNLGPTKGPCRTSQISEEVRAQLKQDIMTSPRTLGYPFSNWEGKSVHRHLQTKYGIFLSLSRVYSLLHELDLRLVMPRPKPAKADKKKDYCFCRNL